jgi:glycosyltransferase, family 1
MKFIFINSNNCFLNTYCCANIVKVKNRGYNLNILFFCSNPVDGGTAKVFYELVQYFDKHKETGDKIFACVDRNNPVELYKQISFLEYLPIIPRHACCTICEDGNYITRLIRKIKNELSYFRFRRNNISCIKEYLQKHSIDAVIVHNGGYVGDDLCNQFIEAAYLLRQQVFCRINVLHNDFEKNMLSRLRYFLYDKKISKESTDLITVSNYTKNRILNSSYITKDIKVIYNGLPQSLSLTEKEKRERLDLSVERQYVLMLGNFQRTKGQLQFVLAASEIAKVKTDVDFVFIGNVYDDTYFLECKQKIAECDLQDRCHIYHGIHNAAEYIDLFDVVAIPSMYDESFGLISVEAMAKAVPVVAFACGGIPEVLEDGKDGYLVSIGDSQTMAKRILNILQNKELRISLGEHGRKNYLRKFSVDVMGEQYLSLVNKYRMEEK